MVIVKEQRLLCNYPLLNKIALGEYTHPQKQLVEGLLGVDIAPATQCWGFKQSAYELDITYEKKTII